MPDRLRRGAADREFYAGNAGCHGRQIGRAGVPRDQPPKVSQRIHEIHSSSAPTVAQAATAQSSVVDRIVQEVAIIDLADRASWVVSIARGSCRAWSKAAR